MRVFKSTLLAAGKLVVDRRKVRKEIYLPAAGRRKDRKELKEINSVQLCEILCVTLCYNISSFNSQTPLFINQFSIVIS